VTKCFRRAKPRQNATEVPPASAFRVIDFSRIRGTVSHGRHRLPTLQWRECPSVSAPGIVRVAGNPFAIPPVYALRQLREAVSGVEEHRNATKRRPNRLSGQHSASLTF
jgi:hypothetical protein